MSYSKIYSQDLNPVFSIEVFPPKTALDFDSLISEISLFKKHDLGFVSVTYGAGGSSQFTTRDLAIRIHRELQIPTAFHFTCVGSGRQAIRDYVANLSAEGIDLVVALRGDPPKDQNQFVPPQDGFQYASELVEFLKQISPKLSLAVAGYPYGHPEAISLEADLENLKRKQDAGAEVVLTQVFYDNAAFFAFVERAQKLGIKIPIIPGLMPIRNDKHVSAAERFSGRPLPESVRRFFGPGMTAEEFQQASMAQAVEQASELLKQGAKGIHFYSMNKSDLVDPILRVLKKQSAL